MHYGKDISRLHYGSDSLEGGQATENIASYQIDTTSFCVDLVQGPYLVHFDSLRAYSSGRKFTCSESVKSRQL